MQEEGLPSVVLALTDREQTIHVATYGYANVDARQPPTEDTLYETGSIGKSFTAIAFLQLKDEGKVDLHAPITEYLPWFEVQTAYDPITIHHLLSHGSGLVGGTDFAPDQRFEVWALRETSTGWAPGEGFHYSNVGYKTLGLILERIEGRPYAEIIKERILDPLGMTNTAAAITHDTRLRLAVPYQRLYDDCPSHASDPLVPATWLQTNTADGCLASSIIDLAGYLRLYLNRGIANGSTVLTPENFGLLTSAVLPTGGTDELGSYGYGFRSGELNGEPILGHGGGMVGYHSDIRCLPGSGFGAAAMINGPGRPAEICRYALRLLQAAAREEPLPPVPEPVDFSVIENADEYAGRYFGPQGTIELEAAEDRLLLHAGGESIVLERRGEDSFFVPDPRLRRYLLDIVRGPDGNVEEVFHGNLRHSVSDGNDASEDDANSGLEPYVGEYRSHNPWFGHLGVMARNGKLHLHFDSATPLEQFPDGSYGYPDAPERLTFDTVVEGKALRATYGGSDFYRFFTGDE